MHSSKRPSDLELLARHKHHFLIGILLLMLGVVAPISQHEAFAAIKKGQPAPTIKVVTTSGQTVTLANYRGYVLIIDFFASWCHPCVKSIPHLIEINNKYGKKGLQVLGLSLDEDKDDLVDFITPKRLNYPVALADEELQTAYGLRSIPTLVLIDKKGVVADVYLGLNDESVKGLEAMIKKLLAE
jgi:cytochrome c biogenesis protein CcmG, thiol:disulfide interchange protein DsbE